MFITVNNGDRIFINVYAFFSNFVHLISTRRLKRRILIGTESVMENREENNPMMYTYTHPLEKIMVYVIIHQKGFNHL